MKVNVTTQNQTSNSKTNLNPQQNQKTIVQPQTQNLNNLSMEQLYQLVLQQLQKQQDQSQNNEFVIKANMKASYIALKIEQMLMLKRRITLSALGFAVAVELDVVMLVRKDLDKLGKKLNIDDVELFEKEVLSNQKKVISGLRITISI